MKSLKLDPTIQTNIIDYIKLQSLENESKEELEGLMKMISPSLRHQVTYQLFIKLI